MTAALSGVIGIGIRFPDGSVQTSSVTSGFISASVHSLVDLSLTEGRVTYAGVSGLLQDSTNLKFDGTYLTAFSIKDSALTSGRVTYAGAGGLLQDSGNLTFDGGTLFVPNINSSVSIVAPNFTGNLNGVATYATYVNTDGGYTKFHWNGQGGQPTWLWGGNAEADSYLYNPANFNVSYATNAGHSSTADSAGNVTWNNVLQKPTNFVYNDGGTYSINISGTAQTARYADLAEKYLPDVQYAPGTVIIFGGVNEITQSTTANDRCVAGVISTDPGLMMNSDLENGQYIALQGRAPTNVVGTVKKGDLMVTSDIPGVAMANNDAKIGTIIGKALEDYNSQEVGTIEVVVGRV